jgi:hypothetical protein
MLIAFFFCWFEWFRPFQSADFAISVSVQRSEVKRLMLTLFDGPVICRVLFFASDGRCGYDLSVKKDETKKSWDEQMEIHQIDGEHQGRALRWIWEGRGNVGNDLSRDVNCLWNFFMEVGSCWKRRMIRYLMISVSLASMWDPIGILRLRSGVLECQESKCGLWSLCCCWYVQTDDEN